MDRQLLKTSWYDQLLTPSETALLSPHHTNNGGSLKRWLWRTKSSIRYVVQVSDTRPTAQRAGNDVEGRIKVRLKKISTETYAEELFKSSVTQFATE